jgi:hypothetical protein
MISPPKLDRRGASGFHGAFARDAQRSDRLDDPVGLLPHGSRLSSQLEPGRHLELVSPWPAGVEA